MTGAGGFLGSALTLHLLANGIKVHALVRKHHGELEGMLDPLNVHVVDTDSEAVEQLVESIAPDAIFHLASVQKEPQDTGAVSEMIASNVTLGVALLRGAARCVKPPVFINTGSYWQFAEDGSLAPNGLYAATKQAFVDVLHYYQAHQGVASLTLILYDTFGLNDPRPKIWTRVLHAARGERIPLTEGGQFIELVHVNDVVSAFQTAAELLESGRATRTIYCVRSDRRITLRELLESFNRRAGTHLDLAWGEVPYWPGQVFMPWQGPLLPGWRAITCIDKAVADYIRQLQEIGDTSTHV